MEPSENCCSEEIKDSDNWCSEEIPVSSNDCCSEEIKDSDNWCSEEIPVSSNDCCSEEITVSDNWCSEEIPESDNCCIYSEKIPVSSNDCCSEEITVSDNCCIYSEEIPVSSNDCCSEEITVSDNWCSEEIPVPSNEYSLYGNMFVDPLPEKYICGICKNLLSQPHVTECCGQHFCEECLKKSASENAIQPSHGFYEGSTLSRLRQNRHSPHYRQYVKPQTSNCPHCRQNNFNHIRYLPFKREIDSMKVHCPRKSSGCNVQVAYGNREDHDKTCPYMEVLCTNRCGKTIFKKDLHSHTRYKCMLRRATCKSCGKIGTYKEIESLGHSSVCPEIWVTCTNSCRARFKRKATQSHDLVCPEATVDCQFAEAGCEVKPKRKDLESHLDANMKQHLSQLMTAHVKMKKEFKAFKDSHGEKEHSSSTAVLKTRGWP